MRSRPRGFSLVEVLVVALLLVMLSAGTAWFLMGHGGTGAGRAEGPIPHARTAVCASNLSQVRQALSIAQMNDPDGHYPQSLSELKLPADMLQCPDGHEPYQYDPTTGIVHCVHQGHQNL